MSAPRHTGTPLPPFALDSLDRQGETVNTDISTLSFRSVRLPLSCGTISPGIVRQGESLVNTKLKFGIGAGIIVASLGWLAWVGAQESKTYYHTIAELSTLQGSAAKHRLRIGGTVRAGSIARFTGRVDFVLEGEGKSLPVSYTASEPLPDTFVDNSQALVEGRLASNGTFVAEKVQAKCASKYEAAPGQDKKTYETPSGAAPEKTS